MKKTVSRIIIIVCLIGVLTLLTFFLKDIVIPFIRYQIQNKHEEASQLLRDSSIFGFLAVSLVEALQMVVIFIPAEFIQITSGISYPFWLSILLCDFGVCLGATIIFILIRTFKFSNDTYKKSEEKIKKLQSKIKKEKSTMLLMYFLFFMPLIPFGAICYYGSSTKIRYPKYILTVSTGVIPSILTSILMGNAASAFLENALPIWLLILIIISLGTLLFLIIFIFLDKVYFKENDGTPDSVVYQIFIKLCHIFRKKKQKLVVDNHLFKESEIKAPYILLTNHVSTFDFYYNLSIDPDNNFSLVGNEYYCKMPGIRTVVKKSGSIPKKLFNKDMGIGLKLKRITHKGYPVIICPEGRLSIDGTNYPIMEKSGAFYKKLGLPLVFVNNNGGYFINPKWRDKFFKKHEMHLTVTRVIKPEELDNLTVEEIDNIIDTELTYNENVTNPNLYHEKNKAKGLERILYYCPNCKKMYTMQSHNNDLYCTECGVRHHINEHYTFDSELKDIHTYYSLIKEMEKEHLDDINLNCDVKTKVFVGKKTNKKKTLKGSCQLTKDYFSFTSKKLSFKIELSKLLALPFSCDKEFELYYNDQLYYFYPTTNKRQVVRWALIVDLIKERENENKEKLTQHL